MSEPGRASSVASANRGPLVPRGGHENGMRGEGQEEGPGLLSGEELGLLRDLLFVFQVGWSDLHIDWMEAEAAALLAEQAAHDTTWPC